MEEQKSGGMSNNLVQISEAGLAMDGFLDDPKVLDLKAQLSQKNDEIQEMVQQFNSMHDQLTMINDELSERDEIDRKELVQLKNQEAETQLSKLFEQQSNEMRENLGHRSQALKNKLLSNVQKHLKIWE